MERIESGFRSLVERLRPSDYLAVTRNRRFRAVQRRRTREAVRVDILVVIVAFVFDAITASEHGLGVVAIDAGLIGLALVSLWSLGHWCRHHPEPVAWIMASGVLFTMPATAFVAPSLAIQSAAYMLVLPGLVALVVPWRTRTHLAWLAMFLVVVTWYFTLDVNGALGGDVRYDLASVLLVACGASLAGRALLQRAQLRNFVQVEHIHALHRQRDDQIAQLTHVHGALRTLGRPFKRQNAGPYTTRLPGWRTERSWLTAWRRGSHSAAPPLLLSCSTSITSRPSMTPSAMPQATRSSWAWQSDSCPRSDQAIRWPVWAVMSSSRSSAT